MMHEKGPKNIMRVACAIIERKDKVLAVQRSGSMNLPLKWEFPGGKIVQGEQPEGTEHSPETGESGPPRYLSAITRQGLPDQSPHRPPGK